MTTANNELSPVYELIGQTIDDIRVNYDLLMFCLGEYQLQANCFARIIFDQKILLTTMDYQSWDEQDYTHNDLYLNIADCGNRIIGQIVRAVDISPVNDLFLTLDNGVRIEIFNSEGTHRFSEETIQWFFHKPQDASYPCLSVSSNHIENEIINPQKTPECL